MSDPAASIFSRRRFINASGGALLAPTILTTAGTLRAEKKADSNETLRIGLIGCGGRGTGAAAQALGADYNTKIVAMADAFDTQIENSIKNLSTKFPDRVDVKPDKKFTGLDAYQKLLDSGVDVVLLATPPGFRPLHLTAAVEAGKHIFCEKPMAVDAVGYRVAQAAVEKAKQKKLNLVAGFCWRYSTSRIECYKRIHDGQIGDVTNILATYYATPVKPMPPAAGRPAGMGDVEWQVRNWYNFSWLGGDGLVEQAVHSLDKLCWALGDKDPIAAVANGGRQRAAEDGNIFDHFHCAYEWDNGVFCHLTNRQITGCHNEVADYIQGTKGRLVIGKGAAPFIEGAKRWRWRGEEKNMYDLEHEALFNSIRKGTVINDGDRMMSSTLIAIMGREAAYTGQKLVWKDDAPAPAPAAKEGKKGVAPTRASLAILSSQQDLAPENLKFSDKFTPTPMPRPGVTKFV